MGEAPEVEERARRGGGIRAQRHRGQQRRGRVLAVVASGEGVARQVEAR